MSSSDSGIYSAMDPHLQYLALQAREGTLTSSEIAVIARVSDLNAWSGTSMAAPVVTSVIALMSAEAKARNKDLTIDQIRTILRDTARPVGAPGT